MLLIRLLGVGTFTTLSAALLVGGIIRLIPPRERSMPPDETTPQTVVLGHPEPSSVAVLANLPACPKEEAAFRESSVSEEAEWTDSVALIPPPATPAIELPRVEMPQRAALPELTTFPPRVRAIRPEAIRIPRTQKLGEDALARQLNTVSEISLYKSLTLAQAQSFNHGGAGLGATTQPPPLLDREGLPALRGEACKLSEADAQHLQKKSLLLRQMLDSPRGGFVNLTTVGSSLDSTYALSQSLFRGPSSRDWLQSESVPVLVQMLMAENSKRRKVLIDALAKIPTPRATVALAQRACFDLDPECRLQAVQALASRPSEEYVGVLMAALRYPWQPVTQHAAEALAALQRKEVIPGLIQMLDQADPSSPYPKAGHKGQFVREMVRINHFRGCMLCHPVSHDTKDLVRGGVPTTDAPISSGTLYYGPRGITITARVTYLRQDFSLPQRVSDPGPWPAQQRFDFLTRERPATPEETSRVLEGQLTRSNEPAIVHALKYLTGEDAGSTADDWKKRFLNRDVTATVRLQGLKDARALTVDEAGTALVAERERIVRLPREGAVSEWHYSVAPIRDLALDARGAVWVAMERATALQRIDLRTQVRTTPTDARSPLHEPMQLARDKHRALYILQGNGKVKYQTAEGAMQSVNLGKHKVQALALNTEGDRLYLAIGNDLWRARVTEAGTVEAPVRVWEGDTALLRLAVDEREVIVVGTAGGVQYLSPEGLRLGQTPLREPVIALAVRGSHAHVLTSSKLYCIELAAVSRP
jgi:hypothetical protein